MILQFLYLKKVVSYNLLSYDIYINIIFVTIFPTTWKIEILVVKILDILTPCFEDYFLKFSFTNIHRVVKIVVAK